MMQQDDQNTAGMKQNSVSAKGGTAQLKWLENGMLVVAGLTFGATAYKAHGYVEEYIRNDHAKTKDAEIEELEEQKTTHGADFLVEKETVIVQGSDTILREGKNVTLAEKLTAVKAAPYEETHPYWAFMDNGAGIVTAASIGLFVGAIAYAGMSYLKYRLGDSQRGPIAEPQ